MKRGNSCQSIENALGLQLTDLSDDLLASILFTNYLGVRCHDVVSILLVCKAFLSLGTKHISFIDYICVGGLVDTPFRLVSPLLKLSYLDLSYNMFGYSMREIVTCSKSLNSLRGLKLRGTKVNDEALLSLRNLELLRYLDLSKIRQEDSNLITDAGVLHIVHLSNLRWVDLSLTFITDDSIRMLCISNPNLHHLALSCCSLITDEASKYFQVLRISTLDISGCNKLTIATIHALVNPENATSTTLIRLCMNYLSNVSSKDAIRLLLRSKSLTQLECRNVYASSKAPEGSNYKIPKNLRQEAYAKFNPCILQHSDLIELKGRYSMINPTPELVQLCPTFSFPYKADNLL